jgi:DNA-binding response OmpR family regulator
MTSINARCERSPQHATSSDQGALVLAAGLDAPTIAYLEKHGLVVIRASTPVETQHALDTVRPDLLVVDVERLGSDGNLLIRELHSRLTCVRVPLVAHASWRSLDGQSQRIPQAVVFKPSLPATLLRTVQLLLSAHRPKPRADD